MDTVTALRCEHVERPLGRNADALRSWLVQSKRLGARQTAYRILVAGALGKLQHGRRICGIPVSGSHSLCRAKAARTTDAGGKSRCGPIREMLLSEPSYWEMGLSPQAVAKQWITAGYPVGDYGIGCAFS